MKKKILPVYLNVYDFLSYNGCMSCLGLGVYHSAVEINDTQFCYSVVDFQQSASGVLMMEPETANYTFNRKIYMGDASVTTQELEDILSNLSKKYVCGKYHAFNFNCNHFADELLQLLVGKGLPSEFFRTTNCLDFSCVCLPSGMLTGKWALQALMEQNK